MSEASINRGKPQAKLVFLGADHGGFELKEKMKTLLKNLSIPFHDLGCHSTEPVDYPIFAFAVAEAVSKNKGSFGIILCTTGIGSCIAANKIKGIRAALAYNQESARRARWDVDANILCLGGGTMNHDEAIKIADTFIHTPFSGLERHKRRISQIEARER